MSDNDAAENGRARVDDDIVFDDRMTGGSLDDIPVVIGREMPRSKRDGLIDPHPFANNRGFANYDPRSVIDEKTRTDAGARMNVDARFGVGDLGDQPRHQFRVQKLQYMCDPVMNDGGHAGITDQDLRKAGGGGISEECRTKVADEHSAGFWQGRRKCSGQFDRILQRLIGRRPIGHKQTAPVHLLKKAVKRAIQDVADEVIDILGITDRP